MRRSVRAERKGNARFIRLAIDSADARGSSKLDPSEFIGGFDLSGFSLLRMGTATSESAFSRTALGPRRARSSTG